MSTKSTATKPAFRKPAPIPGTTTAKMMAEDNFIAAATDEMLPPIVVSIPPPVAAPAKPARAAKTAKAPAVAKPTKPVETPAPSIKEKLVHPPWHGANSKIPKHINLKFDGVTHAKMKWIIDNVPRMKSHQKLVEACLYDFIETLLAKHYTPEEKK